MSVDTSKSTIAGEDEISKYYIKPLDYLYSWEGIRVPNISVDPGKKYTLSMDILTDSPHNILWDANVTGGGYIGNDAGRDYFSVKPSRYTNVNNWEKISMTAGVRPDMINPLTGDPLCSTDINILNHKIYYKNWQLEIKPYPTPYTPSIRRGIVRDYSGNLNNAELSLSETPKWAVSNETNNGHYEFDGNNIIDFTKIEEYNVRPNSEFDTNYDGYRFEPRWNLQIMSGGVLRLTFGETGHSASFGGGGEKLLNGRVYGVTMRVRNETSVGTQRFGAYNPSLQGNWPAVIVKKSLNWQDVSFYMTADSSYGGWVSSTTGLEVGEYFEVDWIRYDLVSNEQSDFHSPKITVMGWIKTNNTTLQDAISMPYSLTSSWLAPYYAYGIATQNNKATFRLNINGTDRSFTAGTIQNDVWHHIALTYDGNVATGYVDGKVVGKHNYSGSITYNGSPYLAIGQKSSTFKGNYFKGFIDNVKIYKRALSENEININYELENPHMK